MDNQKRVCKNCCGLGFVFIESEWGHACRITCEKCFGYKVGSEAETTEGLFEQLDIHSPEFLRQT